MIPKDLIKEGDHIMLKRDDNFWVMQVRVNRFVYVDKHKFTLDCVIGEPYGSKFELKNEAILRIDSSTATKLDIPDCGKGMDNRHIVGKDSNQQLSHEEILAMKKDGLTGDSIVGRLIENSSTFSLKTEYAQDKYIAKKKRKHMPVFIILRPTSRLLIEMYFAKNPGKICHLRPDSLAQILTHANVRAHSNVAVVDTCLGLVLGSVMERLGGFGNVIHIYHGQTPMRPVVDYYDFDRNHMDTLHSFPMEKLNLLKKTGSILTDYEKNNSESVADSSCKKVAKMSIDIKSIKVEPGILVGNTNNNADTSNTTATNKESSSSPEGSKCLDTSEKKTNDDQTSPPVVAGDIKIEEDKETSSSPVVAGDIKIEDEETSSSPVVAGDIKIEEDKETSSSPVVAGDIKEEDEETSEATVNVGKDMETDTPSVNVGKDMETDTPSVNVGKDMETDTPSVNVGKDMETDTPSVNVGKDMETDTPSVNVGKDMETDTPVSTVDNRPNQEMPEDKCKEQLNGAKPEKKRFRGTFEDREAKREIELKKLAAAQEMLTNKKLDCIIVASKFYPTSLVLNLIRYLGPSRQLVVYSQYKEPLMECYAQLREVGGLVNFRLMESWCREYQVLNMRTHPLVNMSGTGGYILIATSITKS